jgi:hypothetical protein
MGQGDHLRADKALGPCSREVALGFKKPFVTICASGVHRASVLTLSLLR